MYSDQTGRFPTTTSQGNKYIMVAYNYYSNAILAEPLKSRSASYLLEAISKMYMYLQSRGIQPKIHVMDNECPSVVKKYLQENNVELRLVPPFQHRANAAEKAIGIFKDHFISGLATVDPNFPLHLWCCLIPLAVTTLNLLRPSRINPKLSAYEFLNGIFDYNKTPLAPPPWL